jgi:outer membrane protein assembly factor BamB
VGCSGATRTDAPGPDPAPAAADAPDNGSLNDRFAALGYRLDWKGYPVVERGNRIRSVDAYDDMLLVQDTENTLNLVEPDTGRNRWAADLGGRLVRYLGNARLDDDEVLNVTETEVRIYAAETGTLISRQRLGVLGNTAPLVIDRTIAIGGATGELFVHDLASGFKDWGYAMGDAIEVPPVLVGGFICTVSREGRLAFLDPNSGASVGRGSLFAGVAVPPAPNASSAYIAGLDQSLWAFRPRGAQEIWRERSEYPLTSRPFEHRGLVYCTIPLRGMTAFRGATGDIVWTNESLAGEVVAVRDEDLIVWDPPHAARVDADTGDIIARVQLPEVELLATPDPVDGPLYAVRFPNELIKYATRR